MPEAQNSKLVVKENIRKGHDGNALFSQYLQEDTVASIAESLHDRWEGKPFWNLVT